MRRSLQPFTLSVGDADVADLRGHARGGPTRWRARTYTDIRRWTEMARGGHFAALEQPAGRAADIAALFRPLRG